VAEQPKVRRRVFSHLPRAESTKSIREEDCQTFEIIHAPEKLQEYYANKKKSSVLRKIALEGPDAPAAWLGAQLQTQLAFPLDGAVNGGKNASANEVLQTLTVSFELCWCSGFAMCQALQQVCISDNCIFRIIIHCTQAFGKHLQNRKTISWECLLLRRTDIAVFV